MSETWKQWQGQVVAGKFPLGQYLGGSEYSAVFLTERGEPTQKAAIKFIQVEESEAELQLARWKRASQLTHAHLLRVLDSGRCHLGDFDLLYVVMEYAQENLAQFLPQRPLTPAEARDVLVPTLSALAHLHAEGLIHGHVRPSNIMAIDDCLKLSSDGISEQPGSSEASAENVSGAVPATARTQTSYDAPEVAAGTLSPAADMWSLGMTLVEMLTQRLPVVEGNASPSVRPQDPQLPETLPGLFLDIARHCLRRDPQSRWTVVEISGRLNPAQRTVSDATSDSAVSEAAAPAATGVKRAVAPPQPDAQAAAPRNEPVHRQTVPARPPLHVQTVAARDSLSKPRYDLAPPRLKRPPLMPKANYLVLGILAALALAAILVGPRVLNHRAATEQAASLESKEPPAAKPAQSPARSKTTKASQKTASSVLTQNAQSSQRAAPTASLTASAHDKQAVNSQAASQPKIAATSTPSAVRSEAAPAVVPNNAGVKPSAGAPGEVLEQVLPEPSQKAQATIHGKVRVQVKVHVDAAGSVTGAEFTSPGPSKYFADLALQAARRWDFAPAKVDGHAVPSEWLIVFHFTPAGPKVFPTQSNP